MTVHTAIYLEKEILEVIKYIGPNKINIIISDTVIALVAAKKKVFEKYKHIISIQCIVHHVNLITTDTAKTAFAKSVLEKCIKIIKFFKNVLHSYTYT